MDRFNKYLYSCLVVRTMCPYNTIVRHCLWLSFRSMSSYKKAMLGKIHHLLLKLPFLLSSLLVNIVFFPLPPSLPVWRHCCCYLLTKMSRLSHSVFKNFHSRERIQKVADLYAGFIRYVWTEAESSKKKLRIQKYLDTCRWGLNFTVIGRFALFCLRVVLLFTT